MKLDDLARMAKDPTVSDRQFRLAADQYLREQKVLKVKAAKVTTRMNLPRVST